MKKSNRPREGICQLTGSEGRFVDSHLIPLALTRLSRTGEKYIETGIGYGTKSRSNSWYDSQLVTREGENVLAAIDTRGIDALRRYKLVWSGWGNIEELISEFDPLEQGIGVRQIELVHAEDLQIFFLSLLWRAAATARREFADVSLPAATLEDLRQRVLHQSAGSFEDYPIQLFQLTSRGVKHNRTPILERKRMPLAAAAGWGKEIEYARFYFDGLTSHIHIPGGVSLESEYLGSCMGLGKNRTTIVFGHRFEESRAWGNIKEVAATVAMEAKKPPSEKSAIAKAVREIL